MDDLPDAESLFIAVHLSHIHELRQILKTNPDLVNEQDHNGGEKLLHLNSNLDTHHFLIGF